VTGRSLAQILVTPAVAGLVALEARFLLLVVEVGDRRVRLASR
jgi:hypothetical protein